MKYALYDIYEADIIELGELLCASDSLIEIKEAANLRISETDGECELRIVEKVTP